MKKNSLRSFCGLLRVKHWIKNSFVLIGLLFSEPPRAPDLILNVFTVTLAFCFISSGVYILNDLIDLEKDKMHPKKRGRPLCSGEISVSKAILFGAFSIFIALFLAFWTSWWSLGFIVGYLVLNVFYTFFFKHMAILDVFCIATGFMLRILTGTLGVGIPPSEWLLLCGLLLTLFLGFTKRRAEMVVFRGEGGEVRKVLSVYSLPLLDTLIAICSTGVILSYSLYTMSPSTVTMHHTQNLFYTVPLVVYGIFRYLLLLHDRNEGEDPASELMRDSQMLMVLLLWTSATMYILYVF